MDAQPHGRKSARLTRSRRTGPRRAVRGLMLRGPVRPTPPVDAREGACPMPIHFEDLDVVSELDGVSSALIVPCNMCPAVTVAVRERRPFLQVHRSLLKSLPFEEYLTGLQSRLADEGVDSRVFRSRLYHQWFLCMWSAGQRRKLRRAAERHDAVVVLGCESATETVREAIGSTDCRVIEGMRVLGIMNAELRFRPPGNVGFENCTVVPITRH